MFKHSRPSSPRGTRRPPPPTGCRSPCPHRRSGRATRSRKRLRSCGHPDFRGSEPSDGPPRHRKVWGSPKLRALQKLAPTKDLALPWVAPSMPWWPLADPWKDAPSQKTLLFIRFRVTPQSVAALVSSAVETAYLDANPTARRNWDSKRLTPQSGLPVMGLFHPSPFLVRETDPLQGGSDSLANALRTVRRQLRAALRAIGSRYGPSPRRTPPRPPIWNLLAAIETRSGDFESSQSAWSQATGSETVLQG